MKFPTFRFRRKRADAPDYVRASARHAVEIDAGLMLIDRMFNFEGRIIDISCGGAMFRPKLAYLMYRRDVPICMSVGSEELFGHIVGTGASGFSVRFDEPLDEEDLIDIIDRFSKPARKAA